MTDATVNIGADEEITIKEVIFLIRDILKSSVQINFDISKPIGQPRRKCDTTRAQKLLGFKAEIPFKDGLKNTIEWYLAQIQKST